MLGQMLQMFSRFEFQKAMKHHVKANHSGYLPTFAIVTTGKEHEQKVVPRIPLEKGDVVVFDR
jgi:hypothetical protein